MKTELAAIAASTALFGYAPKKQQREVLRACLESVANTGARGLHLPDRRSAGRTTLMRHAMLACTLLPAGRTLRLLHVSQRNRQRAEAHRDASAALAGAGMLPAPPRTTPHYHIGVHTGAGRSASLQYALRSDIQTLGAKWDLVCFDAELEMGDQDLDALNQWQAMGATILQTGPPLSPHPHGMRR